MPLHSDPEAQDAIGRLFSYADCHLTSLGQSFEQASIRWALDHFLMTHVAAVQNLMAAAGTNPAGGKLLNAPSLDTLKAVPDIAPVLWAWEARNSVAHRYLEFLSGALFSGALGGAPIGALAIGGSDTPFLHAVLDEKGQSIAAPTQFASNPFGLAVTVLDFWKATYAYVLANPQPGDRYKFTDLWANYKNAPVAKSQQV